jgi:hypothetical protein
MLVQVQLQPAGRIDAHGQRARPELGDDRALGELGEAGVDIDHDRPGEVTPHEGVHLRPLLQQFAHCRKFVERTEQPGQLPDVRTVVVGDVHLGTEPRRQPQLHLQGPLQDANEAEPFERGDGLAGEQLDIGGADEATHRYPSVAPQHLPGDEVVDGPRCRRLTQQVDHRRAGDPGREVVGVPVTVRCLRHRTGELHVRQHPHVRLAEHRADVLRREAALQRGQ